MYGSPLQLVKETTEENVSVKNKRISHNFIIPGEYHHVNLPKSLLQFDVDVFHSSDNKPHIKANNKDI